MIARHIAPTAARAIGLQALTTGYRPEETPMLENVMHDMRRSGRPWALVPDQNQNLEVWVSPLPGMNLLEEEHDSHA